MRIILSMCFLFHCSQIFGQKIILPAAKFSTGNNIAWKEKDFNDASWKTIKANSNWENQGYTDYSGYAWYRFHFKLPSTLRNSSSWKDSLRIYLAKIDDADEAFLNGTKIGSMGSFPEDANGYVGQWNREREYHVATNNPALLWDKENILAVKVYDGGGPGGIFDGTPFINMMQLIDGISLQINSGSTSKDKQTISIKNTISKQIEGELFIKIKDGEEDKVINSSNLPIQLSPFESIEKSIAVFPGKHIDVLVSFKEKNSAKIKSVTLVTPYILTPAPGLNPRINGAKVFGVRPGSPFLFKIAATGKKPLRYAIKNLPAGLQIDEGTGIITGILSKSGDYKTEITVANDLGKVQREFTIKVGDKLALTPPMGWNSWNCWGLSVSSEKVKSSAQALIDKGLIDHGWTFMNIDDGWEAEKRNNDSTIYPNKKFPDMKELGDWLHSKGLKFGIYSSPGTQTCGGYLGSYKNEMKDATTYSGWGIDYLKYDWCSYDDVYRMEKDTSLAAYQKPYRVMQTALRSQPRDITYSLCQYGMKQVWKWGHEVDGNCWRTTGDIVDTWQSLSSIGFNQDKLFPYAHPGRWNDPDMLIVGQVGWGDNLHPTRLTPDEQYTHISLWCLLSSPLLIGCDISKLDDFTLNLLTNDEVLAINQDALGNQAKQILKKPAYQIWMKELEDGSKAIGIFNLSSIYQTITLKWSEINLNKDENVRDLWRQKDLGSYKDIFSTKVAPHGVRLIKVSQ